MTTDDKGVLTVKTTPPDEKELTGPRETAAELLGQIHGLEIKTPEDMVLGAELLVKVKRHADEFGDKKDAIVKPLKEGVKQLEKLFKPVTDTFSEAEKDAKGQIVDYRDSVRDSRKELEEKLLAQVDNDEITLEEAIEEMEKVPGLSKSIVTEAGKVNSSKIKTVQVDDESKLPAEYLVPDMVKIRAAALGVGKDEDGNQRKRIKIPGVKVGWKESLRA